MAAEKLIALVLLVATATNAQDTEANMVGFFARLSGDADVSDGVNLQFSEVITNYGDAYSGNSGIFVSPVGGLYLFTANLQTYGSADTQVYLMRGAIEVCFMEMRPAEWATDSCTSVLELAAGEEIFLRGASDGRLFGGEPGSSSWGGHLIMEIA